MPWVQCCHISMLSVELLDRWIESLCDLLFLALHSMLVYSIVFRKQ